MKKLIVLLTIGIISVLLLLSQGDSEPNFTQAELYEFELLNLCHCHEYLTLKDRDYVKWKSEEAKKKSLEEIRYTVFGQYLSLRLHSQYYQEKYDSSLFLKEGISIYFETDLDFGRLDSLYYEPIVQHYVRNASKTEALPYLGLGDNFFFMDCFYKIKEIPLEQELEYFIKTNKREIVGKNQSFSFINPPIMRNNLEK